MQTKRLNSGQDKIYKHIVQTTFPTKLPPFLHKSICQWGKANFSTTLLTQMSPENMLGVYTGSKYLPLSFQKYSAYYYGTCMHFWLHPKSKAYRIPWARREIRVFHIIHILLLWLCNCRCFLLYCLHIWGDRVRNATGDRKKTSMLRDDKAHTLKEKKKSKPKSSFWSLLRKPKLYKHLRKEEWK